MSLPSSLSQFTSTVSGIPCLVRVLEWEPCVGAALHSDPSFCHPGDGGTGEWEILDRKGRPAAWLTKKLTKAEVERLEQEVFNHMEGF
jgi:hypothetical protein